MAIFDVPVNPEFNEEMRMLETTDPAHASLFNGMFGQMIENDVFLKKEIARRTKTVFLSKAEYDERLAQYQADNTFIDPDSEILFEETIYYINDDYDELVRQAVHIGYTDTHGFGSTNVQGILDILCEWIINLDKKYTLEITASNCTSSSVLLVRTGRNYQFTGTITNPTAITAPIIKLDNFIMSSFGTGLVGFAVDTETFEMLPLTVIDGYVTLNNSVADSGRSYYINLNLIV